MFPTWNPLLTPEAPGPLCPARPVISRDSSPQHQDVPHDPCPQCPTWSSDPTQACSGARLTHLVTWSRSSRVRPRRESRGLSLHPSSSGQEDHSATEMLPLPHTLLLLKVGRGRGDDQGGDISPSTQGPGPRGPRGQEQSNPRGTWNAAAEMGPVSRQARGVRVTSDPWAGLPGWPPSCRQPHSVLWNAVVITPHTACPDAVSVAL